VIPIRKGFLPKRVEEERGKLSGARPARFTWKTSVGTEMLVWYWIECRGCNTTCVYVPKNFIPHMAEEYGFEYELVQYKWPRWLHQQTEKQRIIWGYVSICQH